MKRVLFTGYAPVHFACFRPLYDLLNASGMFDVALAGGLRTKTEDGYSYDAEGMYGPFGIPAEQVLSVDQIQQQDFDVLFAANTKMIAPRSAGARVQIFHGVSFRNKAVREENAGADWYFIVGPYMRRAFAQAHLLPEGDRRALEIGFMKTDRLLNGALDRSATLAKHGLHDNRPVLLYAPTGQKHNSLETMGEEALAQLKAAGEWNIIVKPHDHPKNPIDWRARLAPLEDDHLRISREPDVIELLHCADLLITDASSVSSEYSLLDRPMVFFDVPKLLARSAKGEGSMLDLGTWGRRCGAIVERPEDAPGAVAAALAAPQMHGDIRRAMARDLFYNPGRATEAAAAWLAQLGEIAA